MRDYSGANGLAGAEDGRVYLRCHGETKSPGDRKRLWESASVRYFQSEPEQAALVLFLHEAAHQYHFNDPDLGGDKNARLLALFAKAKGGNRIITKRARVSPREYFAESFAAAHLHPAEIDNRDPEMGEFIKKFLAKKGMSQP